MTGSGLPSFPPSVGLCAALCAYPQILRFTCHLGGKRIHVCPVRGLVRPPDTRFAYTPSALYVHKSYRYRYRYLYGPLTPGPSQTKSFLQALYRSNHTVPDCKVGETRELRVACKPIRLR